MENLLRYFGPGKGKFVGLLVVLVILSLLCLQIFHGPPNLHWYVIIGNIVVLLVYGSVLLFLRWRRKKKDEQAGSAIVAGMKKKEESVPPHRRPAMIKLRENFERALALLKDNSSGRGIYSLPFEVIIGQPQTGKSTAVKNSGIRFPIDPRAEEAGMNTDPNFPLVQGVGGTKDCNWWFGNEAIILDTAGRWHSQQNTSDDGTEWLEFLKMIKYYRPRKPINGVIAFNSVETLLDSPDKIAEYALTMRKRLSELMETLETHVPVYLVFNKCDRIQGFVEYFQDLGRVERLQPWGFTRPYLVRLKRSGKGAESDRESIVRDTAAEMQTLVSRLEDRRLLRISDPALFPSRRAALSVFPEQFRQLVDPVVEFVSHLFEENLYLHNPILRGVYFTSATQVESNPLVELMKGVVGDYGISLDSLALPSERKVDAYFINDLFRAVIFKDEHLAGRFARSFYDRSRILLLGAIVGLTLLIGIWMSLSYRSNDQAGKALTESFRNYKSNDLGLLDEVRIDGLEELRKNLESYFNFGSLDLFTWMFGRSRADKLPDTVSKILTRHIDKALAEDLLTKSESMLRSSDKDVASLLGAFKCYVFLTNGSLADEVNVDQVADFAMKSFSLNTTKKLDSLLLHYAQYGGRSNHQADTSLINSAKAVLKDLLTPREIVRSELLAVEWTGDSLTYQDLFAQDSFIENISAVPARYTVSAWNRLVKELIGGIANKYKSDQLLREILPQQFTEETYREAYFSLGAEEWKNYLRALRISPGASSDPSKYNALFAGDQPLFFRLLRAIAQETLFESGCRIESEFRELHAICTPSRAAGAGARSTLDEFQAYVSKIDAAVKALGDQASAAEGPSDIQTNIVLVTNSLRRYRPILRANDGLIDAPMVYASQQREVAGERVSASQWKPVYDQYLSIRNLYPFSRNSAHEEFASPDVVKSFVDAYQEYVQSQQGQRPLSDIDRISKRLQNPSEYGLLFSIDLQDDLPNAQRCYRVKIADENGLDIKNWSCGGSLAMEFKLKLPNIDLKSPFQFIIETEDGTLRQSSKFKGPWALIQLFETLDNRGGDVFELRIKDCAVRFKIPRSGELRKDCDAFRDPKLPQNP